MIWRQYGHLVGKHKHLIKPFFKWSYSFLRTDSGAADYDNGFAAGWVGLER
jgi:hypothetical protein